jgi:hypothetical protein
MNQRNACTLAMASLCLALFGAIAPANAAIPITPPQNQCPGDCSTCLGPSDPFCDTSQPSAQCQVCQATNAGGVLRIGCVFVGAGVSGHLTCSTTTDAQGNTKCSTSGIGCTGITINP